LSETNLSKAILKGTNLHEANLYGADLHEADLYGANLQNTNLQEANLTDVKGIVCLGIDPRGYRFVGVQHDDGWRISAGCRWFTIDEAKTHWVNNNDALARINTLFEKTV
jgi:uncharacterized protein YjbI with pentapeptide repeats